MLQRLLFLAIGIGVGVLLTGALRDEPAPVVVHEKTLEPAPLCREMPTSTSTATPPCLAANVEIAKLQAALDEARARPATKPSSPADVAVPFPIVPKRFEQAALSSSVNDALKELGRPGEVKAIDCSEYPCIVYAKTHGTRLDYRDLKATKALETLHL